MKKLKWIILSLVGLLAIGGLVGGWAAKSWLSSVLTRESFIRQMETQWNCRADIASLNVALSSTPASIEIKGLVLAKRDADADANTPLASRKPIAAGSGLVSTERVLLEIDLADLMHQRLHVKRLTLSGVNARNDVSKENGNLLEQLFKKPLLLSANMPAPVAASPKPKPAPPPAPSEVAVTPKQPTAPTTTSEPPPHLAPIGEQSQPTKAKHQAAFQASALGIGVVIDEARIENASFHEVNHVVLNRTDVSDLNLTITDVDIDPSDLAHHNTAKIQLGAHLQSKGRAKVGNATQNQDVKIADFTFESSSTIQPLDPTTGELAPAGTLDLLVKKGSTFGGVMTLGDLAGKDKGFENMKKNFGIDVSDLVVGGAIIEDMRTSVAILGPRIEFTKDARLMFADYAVTLRPGSWLNGAEDANEMQLQLVPGEKLAKSVLEGVSAKFGEGLVKTALEIFSDDQGHLAFELVSSQRLTKPKIEIGGKAGALINAFKGLGSGLLKGLIK